MNLHHPAPPRPILPARPGATVQPRPGFAALPGPGRNPAVTHVRPTALQSKAVIPPILAPRPVPHVQPKPRPNLALPPRPISPPARPGLVPGQSPRAPAVPVPLRPPAPAVQRSSPVRVSSPIRAGDGRYRIEASAQGRPVGSLMVHMRNHGAAEVTDLKVDDGARGQGIGKVLLSSAARTALQFGKGRVALASQDNGSGRLTGWYKGIGFRQVGVNQYGFPELEAPVSRVLSGVSSH
jgi:ribosomal protein S18 acetylase RimI-like enzyme